MALNDTELPLSSSVEPNTTALTTHNDGLGDPRVDLANVEAEVARVSQELKKLMDKTHVLKLRINDMYSPIIRLLPPEITSEIFQACIPTFDVSEDASDNAMPLLLGSICVSWRKIAWTTPTLWTALILRLNTNTIITQIALLDAWLARSGDLPLSIRLVSDEEIHWTAPSTPGTAIEVMNKYAGRWCQVDLRIPTSCYKYLPPSDNKFPLLKSLNLNPPGGQGERRHRVDMSSTAQIQHLSLSCVYLVSMKFQWSSVTHLRLEAFYVDECLEALCRTPQLVSCNLRNIIGGDDGHTLPDTPIVLTSLKTLIIDNEKDTHISLLLDTISLPNATYFSYAGRNLIHLPSICSLISRSSSLETFCLDQTLLSPDDAFIQLLRALKHITKFVFSTRSSVTMTTPLDDALLRMCNPSSQAGQAECLLPKLRVLEYRGPHSFTWETLLETLESRLPSRSVSYPGSGKVASDDPSATADGSANASDEAKPYSPPKFDSDLRQIQLYLTDCQKSKLDESTLLRLHALKTYGMKVSLTMSYTDLESKDHCVYTFL